MTESEKPIDLKKLSQGLVYCHGEGEDDAEMALPGGFYFRWPEECAGCRGEVCPNKKFQAPAGTILYTAAEGGEKVSLTSEAVFELKGKPTEDGFFPVALEGANGQAILFWLLLPGDDQASS